MKMVLKKSIGKLRLTGVQLQTVRAETEATFNSTTLINLNDYINHQVAITSAHFLSSSKKIESLQIEDEEYNLDYNNQPKNC